MQIDCMPCFVKQALLEIDGSDLSNEGREKAIRRAMEVLSEIDMTLPPVGVSLILHRELLKMGIDPDPYRKLKETSTKETLDLREELEELIGSSNDGLRTSALMAIAGNVIDYGAKNQLDLKKTLRKGIEKGLVIDDLEKFREELSGARTLTYYLDNSGEVVLDHLFLKQIIKFKPDIRIEVYAKKVPLLNDVTVTDTRYAEIFDDGNIIVKPLENEGWTTPDDVARIGGDIVIAKGQGNYESLSEVTDIYFLLVIKCPVVGDALGGSLGEMVFKKS